MFRINYKQSLSRFYSNTLRPEVQTNSSEATTCKKTLNFKELKFKSKVPTAPIPTPSSDILPKVEIDAKTIRLLERLSLVNLESEEAKKTLEDSINFASRILSIDTTNIEPLYTVLEDTPLELRDDNITDGNIRSEILENAQVTEEEYFVAPPGNIPLKQEPTNTSSGAD